MGTTKSSKRDLPGKRHWSVNPLFFHQAMAESADICQTYTPHGILENEAIHISRMNGLPSLEHNDRGVPMCSPRRQVQR
jgi:hypothetical protein